MENFLTLLSLAWVAVAMLVEYFIPSLTTNLSRFWAWRLGGMGSILLDIAQPSALVHPVSCTE